MRETISRKRGYQLTTLLGLLIAAHAIHWLITPRSAAASDGRWWAVMAQAAIGIAVAAWFSWKARAR